MIKLLAQSWACNKHSINSCHNDHHHYHTLQENNDLDALLFSAYKRPYRGRVFRRSDLNLRKAQAVKWEEGRGCLCTPSSTSKERETRQSVRGRRWEGAGLGLGPPSPEFFLNNTKEFRTPDHRPSWWDLGYREVRPLNGLPFLCSRPKRLLHSHLMHLPSGQRPGVNETPG